MQTANGKRSPARRRDKYVITPMVSDRACRSPRAKRQVSPPATPPKAIDASIPAMPGERIKRESQRPALAYIVASGWEALRMA
jgi:hypothetical protein